MTMTSRWKIRYRLWIAALLPVFGLLAIAGLVIVERRATVRDMQQLQGVVALATDVSGLVHEMQKERGASAVFLGSKGTQLVRELPEQRQLTDSFRKKLLDTAKNMDQGDASAGWRPILDDAQARVAQLDGKRADISQQRIPAPESNVYFTATIGRLLDVVLEMSKSVKSTETSRELTAYVSFLQAKERSGQERATGAPGFAAGKFEPAQHQRFVGVLSDQNTYFRLFDGYAVQSDRDFLKRTVVGEPVAEVERLRKIELETMPGNALNANDGAYWFRMTTARIDMMKKVEDYLAENLRANAAAIGAAARWGFWFTLGSVLVLVAVTAVIMTIAIRSITVPVGAMTAAMGRLAAGDLSTAIPATERRDEIGEMASAVQVFKENGLKVEELHRDQEEAKKRAEAEKHAAMTKLADDFSSRVMGVVETVSSSSSNLKASATALSSTAEQTSQRTANVAAASEQATTNVQTVAAAAEELTASISEIGRQVGQSARIATKAVDEAERTNATVTGLSEAAKRIGEVVKLINDIAGQTNLLALNATIEAARAGDAGKGFAVVASEVKSLANQTAKATEDIAQQINAIQTATAESVTAIKGIGETIAEISKITTTIATAVEEQGSATQEIARNVQQAAQGTGDVTANIAGISEGVGSTKDSAVEVLGAANELSTQSDVLRREVNGFLSGLKSA
jgi:methyl-accepting chemotaxis protein